MWIQPNCIEVGVQDCSKQWVCTAILSCCRQLDYLINHIQIVKVNNHYQANHCYLDFFQNICLTMSAMYHTSHTGSVGVDTKSILLKGKKRKASMYIKQAIQRMKIPIKCFLFLNMHRESCNYQRVFGGNTSFICGWHHLHYSDGAYFFHIIYVYTNVY